MRHTTLVCTFALLLSTAYSLPAEAFIGSTAQTRIEWLFEDEYPTLLVSTSLAPTLMVFGDLYEFLLSGRILAEAPDHSVSLLLDRYELTIVPLPWLIVSLGQYHYQPSSAEIFANNNYFTRLALTDLIIGDLETAARAGFLAQTTAFWRFLYLTATATPFVYPQVLPPVSSPWFPLADLPTTLKLLPFSSEISLDEIRYVNTEPDVPLEWSRPSYAAELGGSFAGLDFALIWYNGWDNDPLVQARVVDIDPYQSFSIELTPVYRKATAAGINLLYTRGAVRLWVDSSYTFHKLFLTNLLDVERRSTQLAEAPYLAYTAGLSYDPRFVPATALLEYSAAHALTDNESLVLPALSSAGAVSVQGWLLDHTILPRVSYIVSATDWSSALLASVGYEPRMDLSFELAAPFFFGEERSELGQYRDKRLLSAAVRWRF